jgi:hypothetical protein
MSQRSSLLALAIAGCAFLILPPALASRQEPGGGEHEEESPLVQQMEKVDKGMKVLRRAVADPAKAAENIALVQSMKDAVLAALPLTPQPFMPLDATQTALWRIGFERKMLGVADTLLQLEQALVEGRFEDAKKGYESLTKLKKEGHDTYVPPEEEEG